MTRRSVELSSMMFRRAVELDSGYAAAYAGLADSLSMLAYHYDDNAALAEARLDPRHQEAHFYLALMYLTIGRAKESLEPMRAAFRLADQDLQTGMMLMCSLRANGLSSADIAARMVAVAERRIAVNPSDERATYVGAQALAELGRTAEAMDWARRAAAFDTGDARTRYNLACLFSILGDVDETIGQLRKLLMSGYARRKITWIRLHDPDLDNVRKDPRFEPLFADYADRAG
jgi:adenylate cyclase